jgi:gas vesicle protein
MNSNSKLILGILTAGLIGVAIGMLLAPERGSDIRSGIKEGIDDLGEKINDFVNEKRNRIKEVAQELKSDISDIHQDTKTAVEHSKKVVS